MVQAAVGFHCPECSRGGRQRVYTTRTLGQLNRPVVTQALIAVNAAVFMLGVSAGDQVGGFFSSTLGRFGLDWGLLGSGSTRAGGSLGVANGEWYRLVTGGFLHAGALHLLMNMAALWFLGSSLEQALGRVRFGVVYVASLLAGSLGVMIASPHQITVGASGAIFGLLGVMVAAQRARGINIWQSGIGSLLVINLLFTFAVPSISIGGHVGGLLGGLVCGQIIGKLAPKGQGNLATFLCAVIGIACFAGALVAAQASVS